MFRVNSNNSFALRSYFDFVVDKNEYQMIHLIRDIHKGNFIHRAVKLLLNLHILVYLVVVAEIHKLFQNCSLMGTVVKIYESTTVAKCNYGDIVYRDSYHGVPRENSNV